MDKNAHVQELKYLDKNKTAAYYGSMNSSEISIIHNKLLTITNWRSEKTAQELEYA